MSRTVIALTGYARAGKDTVADILVRDYGFEKRSFAGPLKKMLRTLDPIITCDWDYAPPLDLECGEVGCCDGGVDDVVVTVPLRLTELDGYTEDELKESFPEYRRLLQVLGTDCVRALDPEFWVNAARREVLTSASDARIVFTDCRFPNEADMIRELEALPNTISVVAAVDGRELPDLAGAHISEQHVGRMGEEWVVDNTHTLDALRAEVGALAEYVGVNSVAGLTAG